MSLHTNSDSIPNKSTIHLTERQLQYIALRAEGKGRSEAVKLAGYGENVRPAAIEGSSNLRKALISSMEARGLTSDKLAEKIRNGIDAKKKHFTSYEGIIKDERETDDNEAQHKYVRTALEIRGDLVQDNSTQINIGLIQIPETKNVDEWNGIK